MNTHTFDGPPPSVQERADDEIYANDVNALAAIFRTDYAGALTSDSAMSFEYVLWNLSQRINTSLSGNQFVADVFDKYGPQAILIALKQAYDHPEPIVSDVTEHP